MAELQNLRVGFGFDIHRFEPGAPLVLGGVRIEHDRGLVSHTDGDAVCHAVMDALFTACGMPDIGTHYPPDDERLRGVSSLELLEETIAELRGTRIARILNLTITILSEHPKIGPVREKIVGRLAASLGLERSQISIAAGTNERFDAIGRGEALAVFANVLLVMKNVGEPLVAPDAVGAEFLLSPNTARPGKNPAPTKKAGSPDDDLPARVQEFEKAVATKLPPLPKAPSPNPGDNLILYTDGASRGNPGQAASGWALFSDQGLLVHEHGGTLGVLTNNEAEYAAATEAVKWLIDNHGRNFHLTLRMDSELVVKQLRGEYKIKAEHLRETAEALRDTLGSFSSVRIEYVPRAENSRADALANRALDEAKKRNLR